MGTHAGTLRRSEDKNNRLLNPCVSASRVRFNPFFDKYIKSLLGS